MYQLMLPRMVRMWQQRLQRLLARLQELEWIQLLPSWLD
jgi:hypothetical protein